MAEFWHLSGVVMPSGNDATSDPVCPVDAPHDSVIQRLFATALQLQSALGRITDAPARHGVRQSVDVRDEIIGEVRSALRER
jgi:hypothetical protein